MLLRNSSASSSKSSPTVYLNGSAASSAPGEDCAARKNSRTARACSLSKTPGAQGGGRGGGGGGGGVRSHLRRAAGRSRGRIERAAARREERRTDLTAELGSSSVRSTEELSTVTSFGPVH